MSVNDPRDSADALKKSPVGDFPSESIPSPSLPPSSGAPGAIDEFVRDVRSRAAGGGVDAAHQKTRFRRGFDGVARYVRTHPLDLAAAAAAAVIAVVVIRAWPTIGDRAGTLGSRLVSALSPTRLVEVPAEDPPAAARPAAAGRPRRATPPAPVVDAPRVPENSPAVPSAEQAIAAQPQAELTRAIETPSAAPLTADNDGAALGTVYSSTDVDVEPPKLLSEGPGQPASVVSERTRVLEVLVKPDGSVEQVRLRSTEPRLLDPILLSRAKMWEFAPAQRAGHPVPYRLVLLWDAPR